MTEIRLIYYAGRILYVHKNPGSFLYVIFWNGPVTRLSFVAGTTMATHPGIRVVKANLIHKLSSIIQYVGQAKLISINSRIPKSAKNKVEPVFDGMAEADADLLQVKLGKHGKNTHDTLVFCIIEATS